MEMDARTEAADDECPDDPVVYRLNGHVKTNIVDRIVMESRARPPYYISELNLDYCSAPKVQGLTDMFYNLQILTLRGVGLIDLSTFPRLVSLHRLELAENKISNGLEIFVESCPNLRMLTMSDNLIATLDDLKPLKPLTLNSLTYMDFQRNPVAALNTYRKSTLDLFTDLLYLDEMSRQGKVFWDSSSSESSEDESEIESGSEESVYSSPGAEKSSPYFKVPGVVALRLPDTCGTGTGLDNPENALDTLPISALPQPTREKCGQFDIFKVPRVVGVRLPDARGVGLDKPENALDTLPISALPQPQPTREKCGQFDIFKVPRVVGVRLPDARGAGLDKPENPLDSLPISALPQPTLKKCGQVNFFKVPRVVAVRLPDGRGTGLDNPESPLDSLPISAFPQPTLKKCRQVNIFKVPRVVGVRLPDARGTEMDKLENALDALPISPLPQATLEKCGQIDIFKVPRVVAVRLPDARGAGLDKPENPLDSLPISAFPQPTLKKCRQVNFFKVPRVVAVRLPDARGTELDKPENPLDSLPISPLPQPTHEKCGKDAIKSAVSRVVAGGKRNERTGKFESDRKMKKIPEVEINTAEILDNGKLSEKPSSIPVAVAVLKAVEDSTKLAKADVPTSVDLVSTTPSEPPSPKVPSTYSSSISNPVLPTFISRPLMLKRLQMDRAPIPIAIRKDKSPKPPSTSTRITRSKSNCGESAEAQVGSLGKFLTSVEERNKGGHPPPTEVLGRSHTRAYTKEFGFKRQSL